MKSLKNPGTLNDSINMRSISAGSFMTSNEDDDRLCHTQAAHVFSSCWPEFNPRIIHVDLWWRKWIWGNFPPKSLILPHYWTSHQCSILICHQGLVQYAHLRLQYHNVSPTPWSADNYIMYTDIFYFISFLKLQGKKWKIFVSYNSFFLSIKQQ